MRHEDEQATLKPDNTYSSKAAPDQEMLARRIAGSEEAKPATPRGTEVPESVEVAEQSELGKLPLCQPSARRNLPNRLHLRSRNLRSRKSLKASSENGLRRLSKWLHKFCFIGLAAMFSSSVQAR